MYAPCHCDRELLSRAPRGLLDAVVRHVPPQRIRLQKCAQVTDILSQHPSTQYDTHCTHPFLPSCTRKATCRSYPQLRKVHRDVERVLTAHTVHARRERLAHCQRLFASVTATSTTGDAATSRVDGTAAIAVVVVAGVALVLRRVRWRVRHRPSLAVALRACWVEMLK